MQESELEELRFDELTRAIERTYRNVESWEEETKAIRAGKPVITEMLEVTSIRGRRVELTDQYKEVTFSPVTFPKAIFSLLQPGDLFLVTIAKNKRSWKVLYLSPPYWSEPWICEDCQQLLTEEDSNAFSQKELGSNVIKFPDRRNIN